MLSLGAQFTTMPALVPSEESTGWRDGCAIPYVPPVRKAARVAHAPLMDEVHSMARMLGDMRASGGLDRFKAAARALTATSTQTLILKIATATDPLALWAVHVALDKRGILPCMRWPANEDSPQMAFVTLCADLLWFSKRNPDHVPAHRGWRGLFAQNAPSPVPAPSWYATAHRQYEYVAARLSVAYWCAKGLALTAAQRQELMTLPTSEMVRDRRTLHATKFAAVRESLLSHAVRHPDKSRERSPKDIAERRAALWRMYLLASCNQAATVKHWQAQTGEGITRQALAKQLDIVHEVLRGLPQHG